MIDMQFEEKDWNFLWIPLCLHAQSQILELPNALAMTTMMGGM
jgi:hypothetical protein